METTSAILYILPSDEPHFASIISSSRASERFPGLLEIECAEIEPVVLEKFVEHSFFGMHNNRLGAYYAQSVCCNGSGAVYTHACDDNGALSMYATDPWSISNAPLQISSYTLQYITVARGIVSKMLNKAAEHLETRLQQIEENERSKDAKKEADTAEESAY